MGAVVLGEAREAHTQLSLRPPRPHTRTPARPPTQHIDRHKAGAMAPKAPAVTGRAASSVPPASSQAAAPQLQAPSDAEAELQKLAVCWLREYEWSGEGLVDACEHGEQSVAAALAVRLLWFGWQPLSGGLSPPARPHGTPN